MKYIVVPETIIPVNYETGEPYADLPKGCTFRSFAFRFWLSDPRGTEAKSDVLTGPEAQLRWLEVVKRFRQADVGDVIELEDSDHKTLANIVKEPRLGFGNAIVSAQFYAYSDAVLSAASENPKPRTKVEETSASAVS